MFPLTWPTLSKSADWNFFYWKFAVTLKKNLFRSKFDLLKIPYFQFVSPKRLIFSHYRAHLCRQKTKKPTYLPTSKIVGRVRGNRNIFNCGLTFDSHLLLSSEKIIPFHSLLNITYWILVWNDNCVCCLTIPACFPSSCKIICAYT